MARRPRSLDVLSARGRAPARRALRASSRKRGARALVGLVVVRRVLRRDRALRAVARAVRSARDELVGDPQGAVGGALVRHRRARPRRALARHLRRARVAARRRGVGARSRLSLGVPIGLLAGYAGRWPDALISRMTDAMLATPFLILAIALAAFLGPSLTNAMIAIGISATPIFIRLTRAQVLSVKVEDYIEAARAVGNPHLRIALAPHPAQRRAAADRAGHARHRRRGDRRGEPVVPGPRASSRRRRAGAACSTPRRTTSSRRRGWRCGRACRYSCWCCRSICWATGCATRSIRVTLETPAASSRSYFNGRPDHGRGGESVGTRFPRDEIGKGIIMAIEDKSRQQSSYAPTTGTPAGQCATAGTRDDATTRQRSLAPRQGTWLGARDYEGSPFGLMRRLSEDMDRLFHNFGFGGAFSRNAGRPPGSEPARHRFGRRISRCTRREGKIVVQADLPGLRKEDVKARSRTTRSFCPGSAAGNPAQRGRRLLERTLVWQLLSRHPLPDGADAANAKRDVPRRHTAHRVPVTQRQRGRTLSRSRIATRAREARRPIPRRSRAAARAPSSRAGPRRECAGRRERGACAGRPNKSGRTRRPLRHLRVETIRRLLASSRSPLGVLRCFLGLLLGCGKT